MEVPVLLVEFEGVIAETATIRAAALAEALSAEGLPVAEDSLGEFLGYGTEEAVRLARRAAGGRDDETAVEIGRLRAERAFASRVGKGVTLRPEAREALERLATSCRLAMVTRASRREVEFVLGLAALEGLFRPVITAEDVSPAKPDRAPYLAALARVGQLFPGQQLRALAVEDHVVGLRAARAAGIASVAVGPLPAHEALEADGWVESLAELSVERVRALSGLSTRERR